MCVGCVGCVGGVSIVWTVLMVRRSIVRQYHIAGNFRMVEMFFVEHHPKIKFSLHNRFYITILSCTNFDV